MSRHVLTRQQFIDEITALPDEAQRQVAEFVAFLRHRHKTGQSGRAVRPANLETEPFVGMWRNRKDLEDASEWVRQIRKSEWSDGA